MNFSELRRSELFGIVAGMILIGSLFLKWFTLGSGPDIERGTNTANWVCGVGSSDCTGFETFPTLRWLLIAAASAPLILSYILIRNHKLSWPRGELTAIVGLIALVLIAFNGFVDKPSENDIQISVSYGYFVALAAAIGIFVSGGLRNVESGGGAGRKPPATY